MLLYYVVHILGYFHTNLLPFIYKVFRVIFNRLFIVFNVFISTWGAFFERSFVYFYLELEKDYEAINKIHYVVIFVVKVVVYIVTGIAIYYFKRDLYLALYIPLFLIIGGWIWFSILKGYIKVKREKEKMEAIKFKKQVEC